MLKSAYRVIQSTVIKDCILPLFFSKERSQAAHREIQADEPEFVSHFLQGQKGVLRVWFHAASVGELESLWPVVIATAEKDAEIILTVFSESAWSSVERLKQALLNYQCRVVYVGYSPWEGKWKEALERMAPTLFITAKYEAWPDLWLSLEELRIPLAIVSARARKSLRIAKWVCERIGGKLPQLYLFACLESDVPPLKDLFPKASIQVVGEPRWDRAFARSEQGSHRAQELMNTYRKLKRPWGVMGSAWLEDLEFLDSALKKMPGSLWVVPHQVDSQSIRKIEKFLISRGLRPLRTTEPGLESSEELNGREPPCLLVNEMGFLSELYAQADWVYVGGGFGDGIHSTIEPAIQGVPIAVGPRGTQKFSEVQALTQTGQLRILARSCQVDEWLKTLFSVCSDNKHDWKQQAKDRLGATQKILETIEKIGRAC